MNYELFGLDCSKDKSGVVKVGVNDRKQIWKECMERSMNVENIWKGGQNRC